MYGVDAQNQPEPGANPRLSSVSTVVSLTGQPYLEADAELDLVGARRHEVRAAECREEVVAALPCW